MQRPDQDSPVFRPGQCSVQTRTVQCSDQDSAVFRPGQQCSDRTVQGSDQNSAVFRPGQQCSDRTVQGSDQNSAELRPDQQGSEQDSVLFRLGQSSVQTRTVQFLDQDSSMCTLDMVS